MRKLAGRLLSGVVAAWLAWSLAALWLGGVGPDSVGAWRAAACVAVVACVAAAAWRGRATAAAAAFSAVISVGYLGLRPSHDRVWNEDQARLPRVEIEGDTLQVRDLRSFRYRSTDDWDARWVDRTFDLTHLQGVDFAVERFSDNEAVAHTLVSFRFTDAPPLVVSVEIRKERGETYGPVRGLFRQYELMYVLADERDALELRAVHRDDPVFLHPMRATPAQARAFLESLMQGARRVQERPRFYNTVTASCTSVLAQHLTSVFDVPLDHRVYLPGYSDALAWDLGLIDTQVDFAATRERNRINDPAHAAAGTEGFSEAIRRDRTDR